MQAWGPRVRLTSPTLKAKWQLVSVTPALGRSETSRSLELSGHTIFLNWWALDSVRNPVWKNKIKSHWESYWPLTSKHKGTHMNRGSHIYHIHKQQQQPRESGAQSQDMNYLGNRIKIGFSAPLCGWWRQSMDTRRWKYLVNSLHLWMQSPRAGPSGLLPSWAPISRVNMLSPVGGECWNPTKRTFKCRVLTQTNSDARNFPLKALRSFFSSRPTVWQGHCQLVSLKEQIWKLSSSLQNLGRD